MDYINAGDSAIVSTELTIVLLSKPAICDTNPKNVTDFRRLEFNTE